VEEIMEGLTGALTDLEAEIAGVPA
jgi:hypothetical protein